MDGSLRARSAEVEHGVAGGARGLFWEVSGSSRRPEAQRNTQDARAAAHRRTRLSPARGAPRAAGGPEGDDTARRSPGSGNRAARGGALGPARSPRRGTAGSQFPSPHASRFLGAPPPGTKRRKGGGGGGARPSSVSNWLLQLSIQNLFLMEGGCHPVCPRSRLPLAANQSSLTPRATSDWGRVSLATQSPVRVSPARARGTISCRTRPSHPPGGSEAAASL